MDQVAVDVALPGQIEPDVLAVPVAEDGAAAFPNGARVLDERLNGRLRALVESGEASGEVGRTLLLHTDGDLRARRVATAGIGRVAEIDADILRTAAAAVVRATTKVGGTLAWLVDEQLPLSAEEQARAVIEGVALASYAPDRWKTKPEDRRTFERVVVCAEDDPALRAAAERAARVAGWVNFARDLANAPPNELTPERLAARASEIAGEVSHLSAEALGPDGLHELGMGAFAAVA
ncbi:MAG TPA: M17 family peptidase N-terminal domain-containing protein, partial [Gaiellaceae bacterium]|nr:M17 family peptidase N-terminal domain-containing protein [Gaiellaceae bacterium]